ncbi:MAG: hypothetical protein MUC97_05280 [Bernardetiaceae bacterium]|jgi:hypothetical protein|nr:hypothetical protein [Bernardetiaceae bacterium]
MTKPKLDTHAIAKYAKQFADTLCTQFYGQHPAISGKQMVELAANRQVNLLAVKNVFFQWQQETQKLRSPFFDYSVPEVAQALTTLMNALSRNISIGRAEYEPILAKAVADTVVLALDPADFFRQELAALGERVDVNNQLKPIGKYFSLNRPLFEQLCEAIAAKGGQMSQAQAQQVATEVAARYQPEDPTAVFRSLSATLPAQPEQFWAAEVPTEDPLDFASNGLDLGDKPLTLSKMSFSLEEENPKAELTASFKTEAAPVAKVVPLNERFSKPEELDTLNERFGQEQSPASLNQRFSQQQPSTATLSDLYKNTKIESLKSFIPLNRKFAFINTLFGGSSQEFSEAVDKIDHCADYHGAIMFIKEHYFRKYNWDLENDEVKEFYELVARKF